MTIATPGPVRLDPVLAGRTAFNATVNEFARNLMVNLMDIASEFGETGKVSMADLVRAVDEAAESTEWRQRPVPWSLGQTDADARPAYLLLARLLVGCVRGDIQAPVQLAPGPIVREPISMTELESIGVSVPEPETEAEKERPSRSGTQEARRAAYRATKTNPMVCANPHCGKPFLGTGGQADRLRNGSEVFCSRGCAAGLAAIKKIGIFARKKAEANGHCDDHDAHMGGEDSSARVPGGTEGQDADTGGQRDKGQLPLAGVGQGAP